MTHVLAQAVETACDEKAEQLNTFKKTIHDYLSRWFYFHRLLQDDSQLISAEALQNAVYELIPVPSAEAVSDYVAADEFAGDYAEPSTGNSFAALFARFGLLFTLSAQFGRAAGLVTPSGTGSEVCLAGEENTSALQDPLQLMSVQSAQVHAGYPKIPPENQIISEKYLHQVITRSQSEIDPAILKSAENVMIAARYPVQENALPTMNAHEAAVANLGLNKHPVAAFKYFQLQESPELTEDNYMYAKGAATHQFADIDIPAEMIDQLEKDIDKQHPEAGRMMREITANSQHALYHVLSGYLYSNGLLKSNSKRAYEWALIAAKLGNVLAYQFLGERLYPYPDRDYEFLMSDIRTSCPGTEAEAVAEKAAYLRESEHYLRIGAYWGHARSSYLLGEAYLWGYFGKVDKELALNYYVQSLIQSPKNSSAYRGVMQAALAIIDDHSKSDKKFEQLSWRDFKADEYFAFYKNVSKAVKTLTAVVELAEEALFKRSVYFQRNNAGVMSVDTLIGDEAIRQLRSSLHMAKAKLKALTLELDVERVLPSPANLMEYGVYFEPRNKGRTVILEPVENDNAPIRKIRELSAMASIDAAIKLGDMYAEGFLVKQNRDKANYFYRQALQLNPNLALDRHMHSRRIRNEEARLMPYLESAMRTAQNPFRLGENHKALIQLSEEMARTYGIQIPSQAKSVEWSAQAIVEPESISTESLDQLQEDIAGLGRKPREKYQRILSALRDGDYSGIPEIISFYANKPDRQFVWTRVAASHGHLASVHLLGRMLRYKALTSIEHIPDVHIMGLKKTALAASLGYFDATRDMIDIVESKELNIAPLVMSVGDLVWFYKNQCYRQDPARTLSILDDLSKDHALSRAKYADGINRRFKPAGENLAWNPVKRDGSDLNMLELFALLKNHHPDAAAVDEMIRQFRSGANTCFEQVADYYISTDVPNLSTASRQLLVVCWSAMGFRSGVTSAATIMYGAKINMEEVPTLPPSLVALFNRIYVDVYRGFYALPIETLSEKLDRLVSDSIVFSAYYYDHMASVVHAKLKNNAKIAGWQRVNLMSTSRALFAQAVMQGRRDWRIYFDFCSETLEVLERIKKVSTSQLSKDLRFLEMEEFIFQSQLEGLHELIELTKLKLQLEYSDLPKVPDEPIYAKYFMHVNELSPRLKKVEAYSLGQRYQDAGIRLSSRQGLFDGLHRPHQPWERNLIPALRSPDFSVEQQYYLRAKTLVLLKGVNSPIMERLDKGVLDTPANMLAMYQLCLQQNKKELAASWLKAAARVGDPVAHRIMLLQRHHTTQELKRLAMYGDVVATEMLAQSSSTLDEYRPLLLTQAQKLKPLYDDRELFQPEEDRTYEAEIQTSLITDYYQYVLALMLGMIGFMLALYSKKHVDQKRKDRERLATQKQKAIETLLSHFGAIPYIHVQYDDRMQNAVVSFPVERQQDIRHVKLIQTNLLHCSLQDKQSIIDPLLQRAMQVLRQLKIIDKQEVVAEDALFSILGIKVSRNRKSEFVFKLSHPGEGRLAYDAAIAKELFEAFVTMSGFVCVYQPDGVCHLQPVDAQEVLIDASVKAFCAVVWNAILLRHEQRIEHAHRLQLEKLAQTAAFEKRYQAAEKSLISYNAGKVADLKAKFTALRDEMRDTKVKLAADVAIICEDIIAKLDRCTKQMEFEDEEALILFESGLTRGLLLLNEDHDLRKKVKEELAVKMKHAVDKAAPNLDQYNGSKKRAEKAKQQADEAKRQAALQQQQALAKAKKAQAVTPASAPAPVVAVAQKPAVVERDKVVRDVDDVDFSTMKMLVPKTARLFPATPARKPSLPPTTTSITIDPELAAIIHRETRDWPFDLIDHHRELLNEILTDVAFSPKSCEQFRLRALSYRLMRYLLFLQSLNDKGGDEVKVPQTVRNQELKRSLKLFVAAIKHNFHLIKLVDLEDCVKRCFLAETDDMNVVISQARRSPLCAVILPRQNNVVIQRNEATIFTELATYFEELKTIDTLYNKLAMCKKLDDACHDGYRGIIMMIGEVGQWLYHACPQLKKEIFLHYPELRDVMYFIVMCHVLHRNHYGHVTDLNALYESSMADFPFVADNLYSAVLCKFVWRGIKVGCQEGLCEQLKHAYFAVKQQLAEGNHHNARQDDFEQELKHSYVEMIDVRLDVTMSSPRLNH